MQNDTIYKTLYKDVYKYKYLQDTIYLTDTVVKIQTKDKETVLDSKHYSRKFYGVLSVILLIIFLICGYELYRICRK